MKINFTTIEYLGYTLKKMGKSYWVVYKEKIDSHTGYTTTLKEAKKMAERKSDRD